jgi:hypothetical protein
MIRVGVKEKEPNDAGVVAHLCYERKKFVRWVAARRPGVFMPAIAGSQARAGGDGISIREPEAGLVGAFGP